MKKKKIFIVSFFFFLMPVFFWGIGHSFLNSMFIDNNLTRESLYSTQITKQKLPDVKEKVPLGPIAISGNVRVPDGRGLPRVKISLYEVTATGTSFIKDVTTTSKGYYSTDLGKQWFNKRIKMIPHYGQFTGEKFSPREYTFEPTTNNWKITRDFTYSGPLPDLACTNVSQTPPYVVRCISQVIQKPYGAEIEIFGSTIPNGLQNVTLPPFKVELQGRLGGSTVRVEDIDEIRIITGGPSWSKRILIPGAKAEDIVISIIRIDIEDSVIESNEKNNVIAGPFY